MSAAWLTLTFLAVAVSVARVEEVMPRLHQLGLMFPHQGRDSIQFILGESAVVFHPDRIQPDLSRLPVPSNVYMERFASITGEKEESVRTTLENRRTHMLDSNAYNNCTIRSAALRILFSESRRTV